MNEFKRKVNLKTKHRNVDSKKKLMNVKRNSAKEVTVKTSSKNLQNSRNNDNKSKSQNQDDSNEIHGHLIEGVTQATGLENEIVRLIEQKITLDKEIELWGTREPTNIQNKFQPAAVALPILKSTTELITDLNLLPKKESQDEGK